MARRLPTAIRAIVSEMKRVTWPSREEWVSATIVTCRTRDRRGDVDVVDQRHRRQVFGAQSESVLEEVTSRATSSKLHAAASSNCWRRSSDPDRKWYVMHTYSGYENKVKANLERRIKSMNMQDFVYRVLVPTDKEVEFKDGKRTRGREEGLPGLRARRDEDDRPVVVRRAQHARRDRFRRLAGLGREAAAARRQRSQDDPQADGHRDAQAEDRLQAKATASRSRPGRSSISRGRSTRSTRKRSACARSSRFSAGRRRSNSNSIKSKRYNVAKKVIAKITLAVPAGKATPAPPVGPALGQHGINIMEFCKAYNERTREPSGQDHPGRHHGVRGPFVHVRPQDAAGIGAHQEGSRR